MINATDTPLELDRGEKVAQFTYLHDDDMAPLEEILQEVKKLPGKTGTCPPDKEQLIRTQTKLGGSNTFKQECLKILCKNHNVISRDKYDIGKTDMFPHEIRMKDEMPVHVKQFRILWAHRQFLDEFVNKMLKQGVIQASRSPFNAPIFCIQKPHGGGLRVVQDFRQLNTASIPEQYIIQEIEDCIDQIGKQQSKVFSTIDLTSGFWQQMMHPNSRKMTAFTVLGRGRFKWTCMPMAGAD